MPELPEVETVRRGLAPVMEGQVITLAEVRRPDLRWPLPANMAQRLTGARIDRLRRRSKYILADLDRGETLLVHLGMSGRMLIDHPNGAAPAGMHANHTSSIPDRDMLGPFQHAQAAAGKHDHVVLWMDAGARITFNDPRRFGMMDLIDTALAEAHPLLAGLGPEPLGNSFDEQHLIAAFRGRKMPVKSALLDQRLLAGLGNIYVCEVLHRAGIHPTRAAGKINAGRVANLVPIIRSVLQEAIAAGGSSLRDHRQPDGELGYFQHDFQAYGREGQACRRAGCQGVIRRIVQSGRSSFYCADCQR